MQKPYEIKETDAEIICPDCGSKHINEDEKFDVTTGHGKKLKQYVCSDCQVKFIPALSGKLHSDIPEPADKIQEWSKKMRMDEGGNDGKSWRKPQDKKEYIIIREKK